MVDAAIDQPAGQESQKEFKSNTIILLVIASAIAVLHIFTNQRYGFHRDELQFLNDARHLEWGFVAYPTTPPTTLI